MKSKTIKLVVGMLLTAAVVTGCGDKKSFRESEDKNTGRELSKETDKDTEKEDSSASSSTEASEESETEEPEAAAIWELGGDDYTVVTNFEPYGEDTKVTITTEKYKDFNCPHISVFDNGDQKISSFVLVYAYEDSQFVNYPFLSIDEIGFADVDFDGNTDVIVIGDTERGKEVGVCISNDNEYSGGMGLNETLSYSVMQKIDGDYTVDKVKEVLFGKDFTGTFASYQDAYKTIAYIFSLDDLDVTHDHNDFNYYDLIYFDSDDTPELLISRGIYGRFIYTYKEGKLYCVAQDLDYPLNDKKGFEYYEKSGVIGKTVWNFELTDKIDSYDYYVMTEKYKLVKKYAVTPDNGYICYNDESLSEDMIKEDIENLGLSGEPKELEATLKYDELISKLN